MGVLDTEVAYFEKHRMEWCEHHLGKVAVVHETTLHGFYDTYETALIAAYDQCGTDQDFLLKEVRIVDRTETLFMMDKSMKDINAFRTREARLAINELADAMGLPFVKRMVTKLDNILTRRQRK